MTVVLTTKQIEELATFAKEDGQPRYTTALSRPLRLKMARLPRSIQV